jgi:hypothetical protein
MLHCSFYCVESLDLPCFSHYSPITSQVSSVTEVDGGAGVPFGVETKFIAEKYEIV